MIEQVGNRYSLHQPIGEGAMGAVYAAYDHLTGQPVAIKIVHLLAGQTSLLGSSTDLRFSLANEFKTLAALRHPHIITVLDYGFDQQRQPYFTMELLHNAMPFLQAAADLSTAEQVELLLQVFQALAYLHRRGIIHRDLKPSNILVTDDLQVKVLDFGLALDREAHKGMAGTLAYMSPELFQGKPASPASDLYAAGMIAYQLWRGEYPYNTNTPTELIADIVHKPPDLSLIHAPAILQRLLAKNPADRYQSATEVINDISQYFNLTPQTTVPIRESFLQTAPFIGRDAEFQQLSAALDQALAGAGSAWLIGGESGVGKSRLLAELRIRALVKGALVLQGQGIAGGGLPYQLWREVLRRLLLTVEVSDFEAGVLQEIVPDADQLLGRAIQPAPFLEGKVAQQRLNNVIADLFQRLPMPVVLILEDVHWAEESLEPLPGLFNHIDRLPLLLIASYRHDERPVLPVEFPNTLRLERFDPGHIVALTTSILGEPGKNQPLLNLLHRETEGNAFFIVEVLRALAEELGDLSQIGTATLPVKIFAGGMQTVIQRRLDAVPLEYRPLLKLAAVLGRRLDLSLLDVSDHWLLTSAEAAVLEVQDGQWQFAHDKLREALVAGLSDRERTALHRQAAEAIERVYPDNRAWAVPLAEHWYHAGDIEKIGFYTQRAGEALFQLGAHQEALRLLQRGLTLLPAEHRQRAGILLLMGHCCRYLGDFQQALPHYHDSIAAARLDDNVQIELQAASNLGILAAIAGDSAAAADQFQQVLANPHLEPELRSIVLNNFSIVAMAENDLAAARRYIEAGLAIAETLETTLPRTTLYNNLCTLLQREGDYALARTYAEKSLLIRREQGHRQGESEILLNLGKIANLSGDTGAAWDYWRQALKLAWEIQTMPVMLTLLAHLALLRLRQGDVQWSAEVYGMIQRHPSGDSIALGSVLKTLSQEMTALATPDDLNTWTTDPAITLSEKVASVLN